MPVVDFKQGTGLERLGQNMLSIIHRELNAELATIDTERAPSDQAFAASMNRVYEAIVTEPVPDDNFHLGHRPSLVRDAGIDRYPNVSVMGEGSSPADEQGDQYDVDSCRVWLEAFVKAESTDGDVDDGEPIVNARIQRTADAIVRIVARNATLDGLVLALQRPPRIDFTDVQVRRQKEGTGARWLWQAVRFDYVFTRYASI